MAGLLDPREGDGTWVENRPSKWQQTWDIFSPYITGPAYAVKGLMDTPLEVLLGAPGTEAAQDEAVANAFNVAGAVTGGSSVVPKPANAVGIFGGRLAKTADLDALAKAERMAADDIGRDEIWSQTGWFQGPDGKWRFEIDDSNYKSRPEALAGTGRLAQADEYLKSIGAPFRLGDPRLDKNLQKEALAWADRPAADATVPIQSYMDHAEFMAAYPDSNVRVGQQSGTQYNGSHIAGTDTIYTGGGSIGRRRESPLRDSTALHELQHWVQQQEGFASGGNPSSIFGHSDPKIRKAVAAEHARLLRPPSWDEWRSNPTWEGVSEAEVRAQFDKAVSDSKKIAKDIYNPINKSAQETAAMNVYKRLAGETEARNVQARMDMTPQERRATPPWWTQDYPFSDQIVRKYGIAGILGGGAAMSAMGQPQEQY